MNSKVLLVLAILVLAVSFVPESEAFTAGGGGNIPRGAKREYEVRFSVNFFHFDLRQNSPTLPISNNLIQTHLKLINPQMKRSDEARIFLSNCGKLKLWIFQ